MKKKSDNATSNDNSSKTNHANKTRTKVHNNANTGSNSKSYKFKSHTHSSNIINMQNSNNVAYESFIIILTATSILLYLVVHFYKPIDIGVTAIYIFDFCVSITLAVDFYRRTKKSKQGIKYVLKHIYEIPAMIPLYGFVLIELEIIHGAAIRSLRLIQIFRMIQMLSRTIIILDRINNRLVFTLFLSISTISAGALSMYVVEHDVPFSRIKSLDDAFWWAIVTFTTVGYGDFYPITSEGRIIATVIMIVGISVLGILISTLGARLLESKIKSQHEKEENALKTLIKKRIDKLQDMNPEDVKSLLILISNIHNEIKAEKTREPISSNNQFNKHNEMNYDTSRPDRFNSKQDYTFNCIKCNNINSQESVYCNKCGHYLENQQQEKK